MRNWIVAAGLFGTAINLGAGPAAAGPYFSCAYTNTIGVEVVAPDAVLVNWRGHQVTLPADMQRNRSHVIVSFGFESERTEHRLMLVTDLGGATTLERWGEPFASSRQRVFPCVLSQRGFLP